MEQFRQLGQTCRQHYEKLVLSAALLIFAVAVYFLYEDSIRQREAIRNSPKGFDNLPVHSVRPASLAANDISSAIQLLAAIFWKMCIANSRVIEEQIRANELVSRLQAGRRVDRGVVCS